MPCPLAILSRCQVYDRSGAAEMISVVPARWCMVDGQLRDVPLEFRKLAPGRYCRPTAKGRSESFVLGRCKLCGVDFSGAVEMTSRVSDALSNSGRNVAGDIDRDCVSSRMFVFSLSGKPQLVFAL